jgi:multidrug efflux pump subunit AcrA (membrane-fusion protein)
MRDLHKKAFWGAGLVSALLIGVTVLAVIAGMFSRTQQRADAAGGSASEPPARFEGGAVPVHTIRPKYDPSFSLSVKAPAQVAAYEWADLEAQVAGKVEYIRKAEGSPVTAGELLIQIAVPDLDEEVKQRESIVQQRKAELKLAEEMEKIAAAAVVVAAKNIEVANAGIKVADAVQDYRGKEYKRLRGLVAEKAATLQVVEEHERYYQAAVADTVRAQADVEKAKASWQEAQAKLAAAKADVQLKKELIEVARKERDRVQAVVDYAKITAPFDGVVIHRNVNRGSFVQNATTAHTEPLLRVERRDIVTVLMKVPDTFAPFVDTNTEAVLEMSELPGQEIHGKVTRFRPTLDSKTNDHTLLVYVDLYNGTETDYQHFLAKEKAKQVPFDDLKDGPLPLVPKVTGPSAGAPPRLYPGMYGEMKLVFRHLPHVYLLPSDAVVRPGGTPYIYVVKDGKAKLVPVEVQVDDQKLAKVAVISKTANGIVKRELTGDEEVIYSNQSELTDGDAVKPIPQDWMP